MMNLKNQYKRLFEARVSSNDAKLLREGTWAVGSKSQLRQVFKDISKLQDDILSQKKSVPQYISTLKKMSKELYNVVGDDEFLDAIDGALTALHTHKFVKANTEEIWEKLAAAKDRLNEIAKDAD